MRLSEGFQTPFIQECVIDAALLLCYFYRKKIYSRLFIQLELLLDYCFCNQKKVSQQEARGIQVWLSWHFLYKLYHIVRERESLLKIYKEFYHRFELKYQLISAEVGTSHRRSDHYSERLLERNFFRTIPFDHRAYRVPGFQSSRQNWVLPTPHPRVFAPPPPRVQRGRNTPWRGREWGDPIPTKGQKLWYYNPFTISIIELITPEF